MNTTKSKNSKKTRVASLLLALVLTFSLFTPLFQVKADAAVPSSYDNIYAGASVTVEMWDDGHRYFKFVPTVSGQYTFYSSSNGSYDPAMYLRNSSGSSLKFDDNSGGNNNFKITYNCTAGTVYYIETWCQYTWIGAFKLNISPAPGTPPQTNTNYETTPGRNSYALFNSGATSSSGHYYSSSQNPNDKSYNNNGYDIYASAGDANTTVNLGLSFTVMQEVTERATITINAYDVDEGSGERDVIFLVDENTGARTRLDYLRGMDEQWNTTTLFVDASKFIEGHTYHLELTGEVYGWVVYVRTVSILLTTSGTPSTNPTGTYITDHSFKATIDSSGTVTPILYLKTNESVTYSLEYAAFINNDQKGSALNRSISTSSEGSAVSDVFYLESGSPAGVYQIDVMVKDSKGNVVASYSTTAGYSSLAVSYHSNGGSSNVPIDSISYRSGDTVNVRFDYVPSREGYTFLGWSTDKNATAAEFTEGGISSFVMGSADVSLYAVWQEGIVIDKTVSIWNGKVATEFGGGDGTSVSPYLINNASQLAYFFERIANGETFSGKYFKLTKNIDLNRIEWASSGTFSGIFDGGNHYIANLNLCSAESTYVGLFSVLSGATIKNLAVSDYVIIAYGSKGYTCGAIAGSVSGSVIKSCSANGYFIVSKAESSTVTIGGIVGAATGASLYDCACTLDISGSHASTFVAGGLIGRVSGNTGATTTVNRCFSTYKSTILADRFDDISGTAGIIGLVIFGKVNISNCVTVLNSNVINAVARRYPNSTGLDNTVTASKNYFVANATATSGYGTEILTGVITPELLSGALGWNMNGLWSYDSSTGLPSLGSFAKPEPHVHDIDWDYDAEPTCTLGGKRHGVCKTCAELVVEILSPLGHEYEITDSAPATCTEDGHSTMTCAVCGSSKHQIIFAKGHDFDEGGACLNCGFKIEVHNHDFTKATTAPTCTAVGYTTYSCSCGYSYRDDYVDQLGHKWDEGKVTTEATCTSNGIITYTCSECQATYDSVILASHSFTETVTLEETCTTDGTLLRHCEACGHEETAVIPAAHKYSEGIGTTPPTCTTPGTEVRICTVCNESNVFEIPKLGHNFYNGSCTVCEATIPDIVVPNESHPQYGMFFEIDDVISGYGPDLVNEYGVLLDFNKDANIKKVAVYLVQEGNMWRRCIACIGDNITYATYVPYLSYSEEIKYTGLNSPWINTFSLSPNKDGIWCYSNYTTIGVNLADAQGNLLLSLFDIGQAGAKTRVFDDLDEMVKWLTEDSECINHTNSSWSVDVYPTCTEEGIQHMDCAVCGLTFKQEKIPAHGHSASAWIVDLAPTCTEEGFRYQECIYCGITIKQEAISPKGHKPEDSWYVLYEPTENAGGKMALNCQVCNDIMQTKPIAPLLTISAASATAAPGSRVEIPITLKNNPGILGAVITVSFDPALKLVDIRSGSALGSLSFTPPNEAPGFCSFVWDGAFTADTNSGILLTLTFELPSDAASAQSYEICVLASDDNILDSSLKGISADTVNGTITVAGEEEISRDLNADGAINVADVISLHRFIKGGFEVTMSNEQADINGDGEVNEEDVAALRQLIAAG